MPKTKSEGTRPFPLAIELVAFAAIFERIQVMELDKSGRTFLCARRSGMWRRSTVHIDEWASSPEIRSWIPDCDDI